MTPIQRSGAPSVSGAPMMALDAEPRPAARSPAPASSPAALYLASLPAQSSRRTMRAALHSLIAAVGFEGDPETFEWAALRYAHVAALRALLAERYAPATANRMLAGLRGVLIAAERAEMISYEDLRRALEGAKAVSGSRLPAGRELTRDELHALISVCQTDPTPAGARDAAIFGVLYAGLRRSEVVALTVEDAQIAGQLLIRRGKGNKERRAYLAPGAAAALAAWKAIRATASGAALFTRIDRGERLTGEGFSAQALYAILQKRAHSAGIAACSPHDFRRSFISHLLAAGVDLVTVSMMAGHADVTTTQRYDRRDDARAAAAAERLDFPYHVLPPAAS